MDVISVPNDDEEAEQFYVSPSRMKTELEQIFNQHHDGDNESAVSGSVYSESEVDGSSQDGQDDDQDNDENPSLKRRAEEDLAPRTFKRQKGILNIDYLDLLNADIQDAAHRVCLVAEAGQLEPSQFGVVLWTSAEKHLFFEALARLGQDDLPGIAGRIGTKSEVEVKHYLSILQRAQLLRQREALRSSLEFSEQSSAVELSQQCCHALDEAADAVSVRQERKEQLREESKWSQCWDITPRIARKLDKGDAAIGGQDLVFARLFNTQAWLRLSDRVFMNSSIPSENWNFIESTPPSMWATTFEDFYSLAVSLTRRLVQTTLFLSMARIRAKRELIPSTRDIVRVQDVEAAIASLGLKPNSREFWRKCARRLRLDVYEEPPDRNDEGEQEPLSYVQVEEAFPGDEHVEPNVEPEPIQLDEELTSGDDILDGSDSDSSAPILDEEEVAIDQEANEILRYSVADFPETHRKKQSLKNRIITERRQEQYAEECDHYANWKAEGAMWDLLQKRPPIEPPKVHEPGPVPRSKLDVESIFPIGRDWRDRTKYHSEWEAERKPDEG